MGVVFPFSAFVLAFFHHSPCSSAIPSPDERRPHASLRDTAEPREDARHVEAEISSEGDAAARQHRHRSQHHQHRSQHHRHEPRTQDHSSHGHSSHGADDRVPQGGVRRPHASLRDTASEISSGHPPTTDDAQEKVVPLAPLDHHHHHHHHDHIGQKKAIHKPSFRKPREDARHVEIAPDGDVESHTARHVEAEVSPEGDVESHTARHVGAEIAPEGDAAARHVEAEQRSTTGQQELQHLSEHHQHRSHTAAAASATSARVSARLLRQREARARELHRPVQAPHCLPSKAVPTVAKTGFFATKPSREHDLDHRHCVDMKNGVDDWYDLCFSVRRRLSNFFSYQFSVFSDAEAFASIRFPHTTSRTLVLKGLLPTCVSC